VKTFSIISALFLVFALWIVLATSSVTRIERGCQPFLWVGKFIESVFLLTYSKGAETVVEKANQFDYGCRYTVWRFFFEEEYLEKKRQEELKAGGYTVEIIGESSEEVDGGSSYISR